MVRFVHGEAATNKKSREYRIWTLMKARCNNKNASSYQYYGGKGIVVCDRWQESFSNFLHDIGRCPGKEYSLDRINSNGNYEKDNCQWATIKEQAINRSVVQKIESNKELRPAFIVARENGLSRSTYTNRISTGWSADDAAKIPAKKYRFVTINGETRKACDWARVFNIKKSTFIYRLNSGWPIEKIINTPTKGNCNAS